MTLKVWKTLIILTFLPFYIALSASVVPVRGTGSVEILSNVGYVDSEGNYRVVGEVQNVGSQTVNFVQVTATFYDSKNSVVDTRFDLTMLYVLLVQRKSPFEIALLDVAESSRVNHYSLNVTFLETSSIPMKLAILSDSNHTDYDGNMHITGSLKNFGSEKLINAKIVATYYDASSHVVAAELISFDPEATGDINPNQTVQFEIELSRERAQYASTYALAAESNQYAMIPEFPLNVLMSGLMFLLITVALIRRRLKTRRS